MNFIESDLFVTMLRGKTITGIKVTSSSYVVGQIAEHTFTFDTPIPLYPENQLMVMYPPETSPPIQSNKCYGGDAIDT